MIKPKLFTARGNWYCQGGGVGRFGETICESYWEWYMDYQISEHERIINTMPRVTNFEVLQW